MSTISEPYLYQPASWIEALDWDMVFGPLVPTADMARIAANSEFHAPPFDARPIHVDLGAGDGSFLLERAGNFPEVRFLGVERLLGRAKKIARKAYRAELSNVRALRIEASYAVQHLFSPQTVSAMTILFPDPWPKRRHHNHRLIQPDFLIHCARCLRPDGWLAIKTDDTPYFEHIQKCLRECRYLIPWNDADPSLLLPEPTDFEKEFVKEGRLIQFVAARVNLEMVE